MERRKFLKILGTTATGAVVLQVSGCGFSMSTGNGADGTSNDLVETTSQYPGDGHTHTLTVTAADLESPPAAAKTYTSSETSGHTHQVTLSPADFDVILSGETSGKTTTLSGSVPHLHTVQFVLS